jgi:hypothetical protein
MVSGARRARESLRLPAARLRTQRRRASPPSHTFLREDWQRAHTALTRSAAPAGSPNRCGYPQGARRRSGSERPPCQPPRQGTGSGRSPRATPPCQRTGRGRTAHRRDCFRSPCPRTVAVTRGAPAGAAAASVPPCHSTSPEDWQRAQPPCHTALPEDWPRAQHRPDKVHGAGLPANRCGYPRGARGRGVGQRSPRGQCAPLGQQPPLRTFTALTGLASRIHFNAC